MTFSASTDPVRNFSNTLAGDVLTDTLRDFKSESNEHFLSDKVRTMNGRIITNHVNHLDNFKKLQDNDSVTSENMKNSRKNNHMSSGKDNKNLGTIQEELQGINGNKDSSGDEDVSSLTSDTDSDSDASLSDSSEEEVEFFPPKKTSKNDNIPVEQLGETTPLQNGGSHEDVSTNTGTNSGPLSSDNTSNRDAKDNHDAALSNDHNTATNGNPEAHKEQNDLNIQMQNKLPRKLKPLGIASLGIGEKPNNEENINLSNSGLQSIPTTSNNYSEQSTGGSDVVIPSAQNPPDLIKGNLNSSGTVSDDSDLKDHARILAELQKIVQDDEMHDSKDEGQSNDGDVGDNVIEDSPQSNESVGKSDGGSNQMNANTGDDGALNGDLNTSGTNAHTDGTKHGFHNNNHHVGKSTIENRNTQIDVGSSGKSTNKGPKNKLDSNVTANGHKDGHVDSGSSTSKNGQQKFDGAQLNDTGTQGAPANMKTKGTKIRSGTSNSLETTPNSSNTSLQAQTTTQPANFPNQDHNLENLEKRLSDLQISNTEQTTEIQRLKSLNQTLKTKFEKLEQSSSYHQNIEEKMLQRNEELEKHLLGMLKSSEIIFDMKENLKTASADNEKLTKDYKEAVKALEAVDKLFGQKDALVKKWKEATEESRQLVELLKKHNAEVGDIETVDGLKQEIAQLKVTVSKAEERNRTADDKNEELAQQSRTWKEKYERENEQAIKLNFELQEVTKELKSHQKLAGKRGRKNQMLQLEITELKDTLKLAKEKLRENERRLKELERKNADTQEMYTKIIHEKEKQQSVLIKTSESYQKDLVSNIENTESLRKEADSLKGNIVALEKEKIEVAEKLRNNEKTLEETLNKKVELGEQLAKLQSDLEASRIEAVDNELYTEEQAVRLQELDDHCRQLQHVLKQHIHSNGSPRNRRPSTAPNRYNRGKKLRPAQTWPSQLDMYRQLLSPPKGLPRRRKSPAKREARYRVQITDKNNDSEDNLDDVTQRFDESSKPISFHPNRPRSTYGNRSLSTNHNEDRHYDREHGGKDWVPKIVLVDSQKLESSSEHDSGSVSADQYAMQYVKNGDRVLFELSVDGKKQNIPGTVKYVGPVYHSNFKSGIYAGLKLDIPAGDTNGTVGERAYFRCLQNHGKFVKLSHILAVQNPRSQQYTRVLPMAYK